MPRPSRRRLRPIVAALGLVVAAVLATVPPAPAAGAGTGTGPGGQPALASVELVDQSTWVRPGDPFTVRVRVTDAPPGATLDMVVHDRLESREEFRRTLEGELGGTELTVPAQPLPGPQGGLAELGFTPGAGGAGLSGPGVYPVLVRLLSPAGDPVAELLTHLTYLKAETPGYTPLQTAVLVDIVAPTALQPDGERSLAGGTLERVQERLEVLRRTPPDVPLTLAPRPETVEALALGDDSETAAVDDLRELARERPVLARTFVDVDLAALARSGLLPEANHQAHGGASVVRTRLSTEPIGGIWLSGPTLGPESARLAVDLGLDRAVVPPSATDDGEGGPAPVPSTPVQLGEGGPLTVVSDPALAEHLTSGAGVVGAHRFLAELTIMWLEAPSIPRAVVVHLPPDADIEPSVVARAFTALADGQAVSVVPVDQVFAVPPAEEGPTTVAPAPRDVDVDLGGIAPELRRARERVAGVGAMLDDPGSTSSAEQALLVATGADTPAADRAAHVERAGAELGAVAGAVSLPDEFEITLTSRSSMIPVTLTNGTDHDLDVRVELDSDQLEFPDGDVLTPVLAQGTTRLEVPVRTRTSGAFTLRVRVTSTDESIILDTATFDVRSTAISGVGLVLSIGAGLFLAVWWARHWRNARRSRHLVQRAAHQGGDRGEGGRSSGGPSPAGTPAADEPSYRPAHMAGQRGRGGP